MADAGLRYVAGAVSRPADRQGEGGLPVAAASDQLARQAVGVKPPAAEEDIPAHGVVAPVDVLGSDVVRLIPEVDETQCPDRPAAGERVAEEVDPPRDVPLPARERLAADERDRRVLESQTDRPQPPRARDDVVVDEDEDLAGRLARAEVSTRVQSRLVGSEEPERGELPPEVRDRLRRPVRGGSVDNQKLERPGVGGLIDDASHGLGKQLATVVRRHDDREHGHGTGRCGAGPSRAQ